MDAATAKELAAALAVFASLVDKLGPGGIIGLLVGSPLLMVIGCATQSHVSGRRLQIMFEEARKCVHDLWEKHREETTRLQESHRQETAVIVREFEAGLNKTTRFYENNVELVNNYQRLADNLQDLILKSAQATEKLAAAVDTLCKTMGQK